MSRKIVIKSCGRCPYRDHQGAFGKIAYVPACGKMENRVLPYTTSVDKYNPKYERVITSLTEIPEWCPLEKEDG